jgi:hypothetical protein
VIEVRDRRVAGGQEDVVVGVGRPERVEVGVVQ